MPKSLAQTIKELPQKPGVYMFKNSQGLVLYVGKAINLKSRVRSYFAQNQQLSERIRQMVEQAVLLDFVVTDNEVESLVLENNFIKQLQPKYNVRLRDDKNYLFLKISIKDEIPTLTYERQVTDRKVRYFGPYTSGLSIKQTLRLVRSVFPYCANTKVSKKPCFYFHINKCPGVCIGKISLADYREHYINKIIKFLQGKQMEVLAELKSQMKTYASKRQFEKAAKIRDQIFALNRVLERQKLVYPKKIDQDVFSMHLEGTVAAINLFIIREGKLIQKENFVMENTKQYQRNELWETFLARYYLDAGNLPQEILLPDKIDDIQLETLLNQRLEELASLAKLKHPNFLSFKNTNANRKIKIYAVHKGPKLKLLKLGQENAKQYLESITDKKLLEEARLLSSLKELQRVLNLPDLPERVEAYDISNIQGTNPVGSMVVFEFGRPKKDQYRKFKIKRKQTPDDFAMMQEMLSRRFPHSLSRTNPTVKSKTDRWPLPNLILIDGGKGQLNVAVKILNSINNLKQTIPVIGLAKRLEEIFLPGQKHSLILPHNSSAKFLLQRIRDEAHRFAVSYHRRLRSKQARSSALDEISGIGQAKKHKLIKVFGSVAKIRSASLGEIANVVGNNLAEKIKASL